MLVHEHLEFWGRTYSDMPAASDGTREWTFGDLDRRANQVGHTLRSLGVDHGSRFAAVAKNCLEWLAIYYGAFKVGAVPVPLNYRLAPPEWIFLLNDSAATVVIAQEEYVEPLESVRSKFDTVAHYVVIGSSPQWDSFDELLDAQPTDKPSASINPDDDLYQMYTSGTTGRPKGAVITHRAVDANIAQLVLPIGSHPGDEVLTVMPLYHAGAAVGSFAQLSAGAHLNLMSEFDAGACVKSLDEQGVSFATFVPAMIQAMLVEVPDVSERKYERLEAITYGASPIAEPTLRRAIEVFGCDFYQGYGMTETTACLTLLFPADHLRAMAGAPKLLLSCGRPVVGTEIRIVDPDDNALPPGAVGEIAARGPQLMKGYWHLPDATGLALRGGWIHTGDAGYRDENGYVYLSDRIKDMIVSGGENIYPREVEDAIFQMDVVADCAVIGVPDDQWGETVKAIVVLRPGGTTTEADIIAWCREQLAGFKRPRSVEFVPELPRNASGKVLKTELRKMYWTGHTRGIG